MRNRRRVFLGMLVLLSGALVAAAAKKPAPLEVTYYYLPG